MNNFDLSWMFNSTDNISSVDFNLSTEASTQKPRFKHRNSNNNEERRKNPRITTEVQPSSTTFTTTTNSKPIFRRKNKFYNTTESGSSTYSDLFLTNTTSRPVTFTNHHRHYHHRYHSISTTGSQTSEGSPGPTEPSSLFDNITESLSTFSRATDSPNKIQYRVSIRIFLHSTH